MQMTVCIHYSSHKYVAKFNKHNQNFPLLVYPLPLSLSLSVCHCAIYIDNYTANEAAFNVNAVANKLKRSTIKPTAGSTR